MVRYDVVLKKSVLKNISVKNNSVKKLICVRKIKNIIVLKILLLENSKKNFVK